MKEYLAKLSSRERYVLAFGAVFLASALVYFLVLDPVFSGLKKYRVEVPLKRADLAWMRGAALEVSQLRASDNGKIAGNGEASLAMIDKTAKQKNLGNSLKRVEPGEKGEVKVWLEKARFIDVISWLDLLKNRGVTVSVFSAERQAEPGTVNARMTLKGSV